MLYQSMSEGSTSLFNVYLETSIYKVRDYVAVLFVPLLSGACSLIHQMPVPICLELKFYCDIYHTSVNKSTYMYYCTLLSLEAGFSYLVGAWTKIMLHSTCTCIYCSKLCSNYGIRHSCQQTGNCVLQK